MQIDISGGTYFTGTDTDGAAKESVITDADSFDLYLYANPDGKVTGPKGITNDDIFGLNGSTTAFYLSVALTPKTDVAGDYGFFLINGQTINVTADMTLGTPPIDGLLKDVAPHDIYDTFYSEIAVSFDSINESCDYNVQDNAGIGPQDLLGCTSTMLYDTFSIDKSNLNSEFQLHFDFYAVDVDPLTKTSQSLIDFAPWSHDAQTVSCITDCGGGPGTGTPVPAPGTIALLGLGLLGLSMRSRRKNA
ncbi:MAG: choice-of-anchor N protein [Gammaproteobacteria bacterium]|nr:choice-of-anchor N protein [Gammaproteobacteria bacterium]